MSCCLQQCHPGARLPGLHQTILAGHSDGASIALIYAATIPAPGLRALVLEAPHVLREEVSVRSIAAAARAYEQGDLRQRLWRYHGANTECAFWGWNRAWLHPDFRKWNIESYLPQVRVPVLVIQGAEDEYGTLRQVEVIEAGCGGPVERLILSACRHSPHRDQPAQTLAAMARFIRAQLADI